MARIGLRPGAAMVALAAAFSLFVWISSAVGQSFVPQGPAPSVGPFGVIQSHDAPPNGTVSGAIQAVLPHPTDVNTMYIGGVNGGVWVTRNGGTTWTPLSDKQSSLSIASLAFDPLDPARNTLIAGIGLTSNGAINFIDPVAGRGGQRIGILYSNNGGATWSELGGATLAGKSIVGVAARGSTLLAAASEPQDPSAAGGLYRSIDGGTSFNLVSGTGGLAGGPVSSLAGDPNNQSVFYAAVSATGVYRSSNGGADWNQVLALGANRVARVATGPNGTIAVGIYDSSGSSTNSATRGQLVSIMHSSDNGASWASLAVPQINFGRQASTDFAIAVDPYDPTIVYVAGDRIDDPPYTVTAYRVVRQPDGTSTVETLTDTGTSDGSTTHADARFLAFDALGRLIQGGDGGLYVRSNPQGVGTWTGLNTAGLSLREAYAVAYDSISRRLVVSAQDTGTAYQSSPGSQGYDAIGGGGDGVNAVVNDKTLRGQGLSVIYTTSQNLSPLERRVVDASGTVVSLHTFGTRQGTDDVLGFASDDFTDVPRRVPERSVPFSSRIVLNKIDPQKIALGTNYVYTTVDANGASDRLFLTNMATPGTPIGPISALAYGANDNIDALLAGSDNGLYFTATAAPGSLQRLAAYAGGGPTSVVFDNRAQARFFAADTVNLWGTTDSGTSFTDLTANLAAANLIRPTSVEFISSNGVDALLVGGLNNIPFAQSPIAVADSDGTGALSGWRPFGTGLPNTIVNQLHYNDNVDVLAVGLFGRGAWLLYDVTAYFPTATVLRFGLADNDSFPAASFLSGARNLEKVGIGTLTVTGTTTYSGNTTVFGGRMIVNGDITSSSGVLVDVPGTLGGNGIVPNATINGAIAPGNSIGTLTVSGTYVQNPGSVYEVEANAAGQADRIDVTGAPGTATINGGTVNVVAAPGNYVPRRTYTILSATGGVTGAYDSVVTNYPFLLGALSYAANDIFLSLTPGGFANGAQTPNQRVVGGVLDQSVASANGDFATVIGGLSMMSLSQAPAVFDQLGGQNYSAFSSTAVQVAQLFMNNFTQQVGGGTSGGGRRVALAEACEVACQPSQRWGAWGGAIGGAGTVAGDANGRGVSYYIGGFAAGLDYRFDPQFLAGVTVGYAGTTQYTQGFSGRGTSDTVQVGLYGSFTEGSFYADVLAGYAHGSNRQQRPIFIPAIMGRTAWGQTTVDQFFGQVEAGYKIGMGGAADTVVTPFARLQASTARQAAFTETGADSINLNVAAQTTNSLRSVLGVQLGNKVDVGLRDRLNLMVRFGWAHEFEDTSRPVTASFAGAPTLPFVTQGAAAPRDGVILGLGGSTAIADSTSVYVRYDGDIAGDNTAHVFSAGLRVTW